MSLIPLHRTTLFYWEGGRGTGDGGRGGRSPGEERVGRGISTTTVCKREIRKGKLSFIIQSKKRTQQLPFNVLRGLKQNFICEKNQKTKIRTRDKKKNSITSVQIGNLSKSLTS